MERDSEEQLGTEVPKFMVSVILSTVMMNNENDVRNGYGAPPYKYYFVDDFLLYTTLLHAVPNFFSNFILRRYLRSLYAIYSRTTSFS